MPIDKAFVTDALRTVTDPRGGDVVSAGHLLHASGCDGFAAAKISSVGLGTMESLNALAHAGHEALRSAAGKAGETLASFTVEFANAAGRVVHQVRFGATPPGERTAPTAAQAAASAQAGHRPIPGLAPSPQGSAGVMAGVKRVIAVGAGKGGVGKSTIAVNLAVGLARRGHAVGLLDADIYGPSIPTLLGLHEFDQAVMGGKLQPFYVHGVKSVTVGKLVDPDKPLIWRGPMAHGAVKQLTEQTEWGELDELVLDLPPGTGDVPLTIAQTLKVTGAVVVCTPQRVAQDDAARAAGMFAQLGIDVLGVVENMSHFVGDDGKEYDLFGRGGARKMAQRLGLPFLGEVPITSALRQNSDAGDPTANFTGGGALARALEAVVDAVDAQASLAAVRQGRARPTLTIS